jgi:hypothetical protein
MAEHRVVVVGNAVWTLSRGRCLRERPHVYASQIWPALKAQVVFRNSPPCLFVALHQQRHADVHVEVPAGTARASPAAVSL